MKIFYSKKRTLLMVLILVAVTFSIIEVNFMTLTNTVPSFTVATTQSSHSLIVRNTLHSNQSVNATGRITSYSNQPRNVTGRITSHSNPPTNVTGRTCSYSNAGVCLSELPVPEAFSESGFYGDRRIMKYRWFFKPNKTRHFQLDHRFLKGSAKACTPNERHQLVVLVLTMHHMESQRQAIRDTWGSVSTLGTWPGSTEKFSIKLLFILGVSKNDSLNIAVSKEGEKTGDLIIAGFDESYYNLTRKVLVGFKWIREFCPTAKYVMKVDEDIYINIPQFAASMNSRKWDNLIYGLYFMASSVERGGKYMVSREIYPIEMYPPHVKGIVYFMTTDAAMKILAVSEYMPYINIEDVHMTGILAKIFNFRHVALSPDLYYTNKPATSCQLVNGNKMISQQIFTKQLYEIWSRVKDPSLCETVQSKSL
ncbi:beta-1,3-galactosyltransferase 5-like [Gigantopelta aegis]|uniref:beta-1,3-galactosyltransferase 5-like n=1 Tax=Gigantopelta aegis TaxID=1735272 RepID=UPI001B88D945|nr:beta-1,3-galactosyltransferase 5-like [Gigantopelta aegis]